MVKKYVVRLSDEGRSLLEDTVKKLKGTAQKVLLVCDNLNIHTPDAFYEAFDAQYAR